MSMTTTIEVELRRSLERAGVLHPPGACLTVPIDEATALIEAGFAAPAGAPLDFGQVLRRNWIKKWRT